MDRSISFVRLMTGSLLIESQGSSALRENFSASKPNVLQAQSLAPATDPPGQLMDCP
jgi:hypothetical protein